MQDTIQALHSRLCRLEGRSQDGYGLDRREYRINHFSGNMQRIMIDYDRVSVGRRGDQYSVTVQCNYLNFKSWQGIRVAEPLHWMIEHFVQFAISHQDRLAPHPHNIIDGIQNMRFVPDTIPERFGIWRLNREHEGQSDIIVRKANILPGPTNWCAIVWDGSFRDGLEHTLHIELITEARSDALTSFWNVHLRIRIDRNREPYETLRGIVFELRPVS
jgi:hypothetical protein